MKRWLGIELIEIDQLDSTVELERSEITALVMTVH